LLSVQLCFVTCTLALRYAAAVTASDCAGGAGPPAAALKVTAEGLKISVPDDALATFSVTGTVCVTEPEVSEIVPLHVAPPVSPVRFTEIVKVVFAVLAMKLPVGDNVSHVLLVQLCSDTCAVALVLACAVTVKVCAVGALPPANPLNVNPEELKLSGPVVAELTFNVTFAVCVTEPAVIVIVPLHVEPPAIPA
jgi:hypothetical protein